MRFLTSKFIVFFVSTFFLSSLQADISNKKLNQNNLEALLIPSDSLIQVKQSLTIGPKDQILKAIIQKEIQTKLSNVKVCYEQKHNYCFGNTTDDIYKELYSNAYFEISQAKTISFFELYYMQQALEKTLLDIDGKNSSHKLKIRDLNATLFLILELSKTKQLDALKLAKLESSLPEVLPSHADTLKEFSDKIISKINSERFLNFQSFNLKHNPHLNFILDY